MDNAAGRTSVKHFVMQSLICKRTRLSLEARVECGVEEHVVILAIAFKACTGAEQGK